MCPHTVQSKRNSVKPDKILPSRSCCSSQGTMNKSKQNVLSAVKDNKSKVKVRAGGQGRPLGGGDIWTEAQRRRSWGSGCSRQSSRCVAPWSGKSLVGSRTARRSV